MSTRYLQILAVGSPVELLPDANNRAVFSMNFETMLAADGDDLLGEIGSIISNASLGTGGTDLFYGMQHKYPTVNQSSGDGHGPYVRILATGGPHTLETHDGSEYERPTVQVVVTGVVYNTTRTRAYAIWRALKGIRELTIAA